MAGFFEEFPQGRLGTKGAGLDDDKIVMPGVVKKRFEDPGKSVGGFMNPNDTVAPGH